MRTLLTYIFGACMLCSFALQAQEAKPENSSSKEENAEWLFVLTADSAEITFAEDNTMDIALSGADTHMTAFTDRPVRKLLQ